MIYWYCWGYKTFTGPQPNIKRPASPASDMAEKTCAPLNAIVGLDAKSVSDRTCDGEYIYDNVK